MAGPSPAVPTPSPSPQEVQFSASFLGANSAGYNLERYERGNPVIPGDYLVDVYVNGFRVTREQVSFVTPAAGGEAQACLTRDLLGVMGVDLAKLEAASADLDGCVDLVSLIPDAYASFDNSQLRLELSIPQVALSRTPRGYVDPKLWDQGVNAFTLGYNINATHGDYKDGPNSDSLYLGLNAGLNVGGWRIRNQSSYRWDKATGSDFEAINTYAQHDITSLQSQLTIGDSATVGNIFDSVVFRGVQLATDSRMRPDSMNGFAPTVRGTAETNAKVAVYQNGFIIYETTVAPGSFEINDLYASSVGGDLEVVVTEADGRVRSYKVPYAAVPQLLRPGVSNYSATLGEVRNNSLINRAPRFLEGTYQRGFNNWLTGYAGAQITDGSMYRSALVGAAFNTPIGAVSLDVTGSKSRFAATGERRNGYSARVTYNKNIPATNTEFALAAYRYSSEGYLSLNDATVLNDFLQSPQQYQSLRRLGSERSRFQVTVSQRLTERTGSLFFSGSRNDYWDLERPVDYSYQLGWNNRFRDATYGISANRARLSGGGYDNSIFLNFSLPLGRTTQRGTPPMLTMGGSHTPSGNGIQAGVTGIAGARNQFNYGVNGTFNNNNNNSLGVNGSWRAPYATVGASYTHGSTAKSASISASGGLVVHSGGITFAPQLGETIGIVKAKGAKGASLSSDRANKVDGRGFLITTNLMPYRMNEVMLDPKGSSLDVELETSRLQVAPRAGAVVALEFGTKSGKAMLVRGALENGEALPFGARVTDDAGTEIGLVGQGGQVFVRDSNEAAGDWNVSWGGGESCVLERPAAPTTAGNDIEVVRAMCRSYK